jgi:pimeloyl-ACP methyl ester carboxylesterase
MSATMDNTLRISNATIFYRVRGFGPLLLILPGGDGDADSADTMCEQLGDRYTVVTYDRRGLSRSTVDPGAPPPTIATHGDDAHRLLAALTSQPAYVFGSSIGAVIGLDLALRHPEQVRALVAHKPPVWNVLPDGERDQAVRAQQDIETAFQREGIVSAFQKIVALAAVDYEDREPDVTLSPPTTPEWTANLRFFFTHDAPAVNRYLLDLDALRAAVRDVALVEFPSGHTGWLLRPKEFAAKLGEVLTECDHE